MAEPKPRVHKFSAADLAELRALDGARCIAEAAAQTHQQYLVARMKEILKENGYDVDADKSTWEPDLRIGVVVETSMGEGATTSPKPSAKSKKSS